MDEQFGGKQNPSTWTFPGVGTAQYMTGQPVLNAAINYSQGPQAWQCSRVYQEHPNKYYFSHDPWVCADVYSHIQVPTGMQAFYEPCGCGVTLKERPMQYMCSAQDRDANCTNVPFEPVCGFDRLNQLRISYTNSCAACKNPHVTAYTKGGRC